MGAAVVFTIAWFALAPAPAAPGPWDHAPMAVCSEPGGTVLRADVDGDGHVDLALFWSGPTLGDDPVDDMPIHEVHFGPLSRDLTSERVGPLRTDYESFVSEVRAGDLDGDGRAELQAIQYAGDGVYEPFLSSVQG